jgi:hypothetical protein
MNERELFLWMTARHYHLRLNEIGRELANMTRYIEGAEVWEWTDTRRRLTRIGKDLSKAQHEFLMHSLDLHNPGPDGPDMPQEED